MFAALTEDLAAAHSSVERDDDDRFQMRDGRIEEETLLRYAEDSARTSRFGELAVPAQRIGREKSLVDRPEQNVPQDRDIAVDGRVAHIFQTAGAVRIDHRTGNRSDPPW